MEDVHFSPEDDMDEGEGDEDVDVEMDFAEETGSEDSSRTEDDGDDDDEDDEEDVDADTGGSEGVWQDEDEDEEDLVENDAEAADVDDGDDDGEDDGQDDDEDGVVAWPEVRHISLPKTRRVLIITREKKCLALRRAKTRKISPVSCALMHIPVILMSSGGVPIVRDEQGDAEWLDEEFVSRTFKPLCFLTCCHRFDADDLGVLEARDPPFTSIFGIGNPFSDPADGAPRVQQIVWHGGGGRRGRYRSQKCAISS
jgi:hypothetical protein